MNFRRTLSFLFAFFLGGLVSSSSAANVQGILGGDTTWTLAQSPIYVLGNVQVPAGVALTIEPGVEVRFTGAYEILVQGRVSALGTSTLPIRFNSVTAGVNSTATAFRFHGADLSLSALSHLRFSDLTRAIRVGQETEHNQGGKNSGTLTVSGVHASSVEFLTNGYQTTASLLLEDVDFNNVTLTGAYPNSEPVTLRRGRLLNSIVHSDSYNRGITLESVQTDSTSFRLGCCGANITVRDSHLRGGSFSQHNDYYQVTIERSLLESVPLVLPQAARVTITDSLLVYSSGTGVQANNLTLSGSTVRGAQTGLSLSGTFQLANSSITSNQTGLALATQASGSISSTNFSFNSSLNLRNDSARPITASGNYWGVISAQAIEASITHYHDDINRGLVSFSPFLSNPSPSAPLSPPGSVVKSASASDILVQWAASSDPRVTGYRLYYGSNGSGGFAGQVTLGAVTSHTLSGRALTDAFAVTALSALADGSNDQREGHESWFAYAQTASPQIQVSPAAPSFGAVAVGSTSSLTLTVTNPGTGPLQISNVTSSNARFSASSTSLLVPAGEQRDLTLAFNPSSSGWQQSTITLTHNASPSTLTLIVKGYGAPSSGRGVEGILVGDTTWTLAQSPIYVLGNVQVPAGVALTIEPGVEVRFTGAYEILVQGRVSALGTSTLPIRFNSVTAGVNSAATAFRFHGADLSLSALSHLRFSDLTRAIRVGQETEHNQGGKNS
ncbi:MAG TPA: choice-of-anchor D domain-containing protein, partial [Chthoniobacteraceae bacterium]